MWLWALLLCLVNMIDHCYHYHYPWHRCESQVKKRMYQKGREKGQRGGEVPFMSWISVADRRTRLCCPHELHWMAGKEDELTVNYRKWPWQTSKDQTNKVAREKVTKKAWKEAGSDRSVTETTLTHTCQEFRRGLPAVGPQHLSDPQAAASFKYRHV